MLQMMRQTYKFSTLKLTSVMLGDFSNQENVRCHEVVQQNCRPLQYPTSVNIWSSLRCIFTAESVFRFLSIRLRYVLLSSFFAAMNILVTSDMQRIKIADFDTVIMLLDELTKQGLRRVGTPGYCAPEVIAVFT